MGVYMYKFRIDKLELNTIDGVIDFEPRRINVVIGPNNSGKSRFLKELRDWLSGDKTDIKIINQIEYVTEDISTHAKFLGKWYEKSEEPIVSMNYW